MSHPSYDPYNRASVFRGFGRIALFFAVFSAAAIAFNWVILEGLRKKNASKFGAMNQWTAGRANAEVVINGSSRALVHYDPRVIQKTTGMSSYNLGMNGVQIDIQLAVLKAYLSTNSAPKIVIQNLEAFSFEATKVREIYDPGLYIPYLHITSLYDGLHQIDPSVWKWRHIPLYGYSVEDMRFTWIWGLLAHAGVEGKNDYFQGFNPRFIEWNRDFDSFQSGMQAGITYRIEPKGVAALQEIIDLCAQANIRLILVFSPEYYEMQQLVRNRGEIFQKFEQMAATAKIPFWDFSDQTFSRSKDNFYNSQHLNARGASLFSEAFAAKLKDHTLRNPFQ